MSDLTELASGAATPGEFIACVDGSHATPPSFVTRDEP